MTAATDNLLWAAEKVLEWRRNNMSLAVAERAPSWATQQAVAERAAIWALEQAVAEVKREVVS